jgi:hypothetical protein
MLCRYRCSNLSQVPTPFAWSLRPANGAGKAVLWEFNEDLMGNSEYLWKIGSLTMFNHQQMDEFMRISWDL